MPLSFQADSFQSDTFEATTPGVVVAPTYADVQNLAEGIGTRALPAVTTVAGDWLVVEIIAEADTVGETYPPTCPSLTLTNQTDSGTGASNDVHVFQYTSPDATGASRTVTITPSNATRKYRAQVTVVRGSAGPGSGKGTTQAAQTVTVTPQGTNSGMFLTFGDFSVLPSAAGQAFYQPGAAVSISTTDGTGADYYFGRLNSSGSPTSTAYGVSVALATLTTPAGAVLEMLGSSSLGDDGPQTVPLQLPSLSYGFDDASMALSTIFGMRPWQRRFQWVTQPWLCGDDAPVAAFTNAPADVANLTIIADDQTVTTGVSTPTVVGTPTSTTGSATTSTALAWDAGAVAGNLLVAFVSQVGAAAISSTSVGATQVQRGTTAGSTASLTAFVKVLSSGDIAAGTFTATFASSQRHAITLYVLTNQSGLDGVGTVTTSGSTTTVSVTAQTPGHNDTLVLGGVGGQVTTTSTDVHWTWPGPLVEQTDVVGTGAVARAFLTTGIQPEPGSPVASGPDAPVPDTAVAYVSFRLSVLPAGTSATNALPDFGDWSVSAQDVTPAVLPNAEATSVTATAGDALPAVATNAEAAGLSFAGADATTQVTPNAEAASLTATAQSPTGTVAPNAEAASLSFTASDATVSTATATNAPAEAATLTATAGDALPSVAVAATASAVSFTADNAAATTAPNAEAASVAITGADAASSLSVNAEASSLTLTSGPATPAVGASDGGSSLSVAGSDGTGSVSVNAEAAGPSFTAGDATVSTSSAANAPAEAATLSLAGADPTTAVTVAPAEAQWSVSGLDAAGSTATFTNAAAQAASVAFAAADPAPAIAAPAEAGTAALGAGDPAPAVGAAAEAAALTGAAGDATIPAATSAQAQTASFAFVSLDVAAWVAVASDVALASLAAGNVLSGTTPGVMAPADAPVAEMATAATPAASTSAMATASTTPAGMSPGAAPAPGMSTAPTTTPRMSGTT